MIDNGKAEDRRALIEALAKHHIPAFEHQSGGHNYHVCVSLIDEVKGANTWDAELRARVDNEMRAAGIDTTLWIMTSTAETACDVGLWGWDGVGGVGGDFEPADSLDAAVEVFVRYWCERDKWIRAYVDGELAYE